MTIMEREIKDINWDHIQEIIEEEIKKCSNIVYTKGMSTLYDFQKSFESPNISLERLIELYFETEKEDLAVIFDGFQSVGKYFKNNESLESIIEFSKMNLLKFIFVINLRTGKIKEARFESKPFFFHNRSLSCLSNIRDLDLKVFEMQLMFGKNLNLDSTIKLFDKVEEWALKNISLNKKGIEKEYKEAAERVFKRIKTEEKSLYLNSDDIVFERDSYFYYFE